MRNAQILALGLVWLLAICSPASAQEEPGFGAFPPGYTLTRMDPNLVNNWLARWKAYISSDSRNRYCDTAMGEDVAWLMQPFLNGFYYGYLATRDANWVAMEADWADSWIRRKLTEPDGYAGWPKVGSAGTNVDRLNSYYADSLLGDAMALRPIVLMSAEILRTPSLNAVYGTKAQSYLDLAKQMYNKWVSRGAMRDTAGGGAISIVLPYGIDANTNAWTPGYALRNNPAFGFSHPDNKANEVAMWMTALYDATGDANYRNQAEKWYRVMKSRMTLQSDGNYRIWNYWQAAGGWDYDPNTGGTKHWVGVHPNAGYYETDVTSIVDAYEHGLVFTKSDIDHLVSTAISSGRYWTALAPYSPEIQQHFEADFQPDSWGGLGTAPWYLNLQVQIPEPGSAALLVCGAAAFLRRRLRAQ